MKLLLIDAQVLFGDGLAALLNAQPGFQVLGRASSMAEALRMVEQLEPEVVLTDAYLPDGDGVDITRRIVQTRPCTHVVFLTTHDDDAVIFPALKAGAQGYLLKNTSLPQLLDYLHRVEHSEPVFSPSIMSRLLHVFAQEPLPRMRPEGCTELTARELDVLRELGTGASNREIARQLSITENTVKNHVRNILVKLNMRSRHEARAFANRELK